MSPPCAGFIILTQNKDKVLLITTHRNIIGFPKGKKKKNEDSIQVAYRELQEETGLTSDMIRPIEGLYVDEMSIKGILLKKVLQNLNGYNFAILFLKVYFENVEQAMIQLMTKRKIVLSSAINLIN